jgi:hypothetical protein
MRTPRIPVTPGRIAHLRQVGEAGACADFEAKVRAYAARTAQAYLAAGLFGSAQSRDELIEAGASGVRDAIKELPPP